MKSNLTVQYLLIVLVATATTAQAASFRRLSVQEYRDKMKAGWIGQMAGVTWGAPTEFKFNDRIIPEDRIPVWKPEMINDAFGQDDLYVEMTFLRSLEEHGLDVSIRQAGIDFANSRYNVWCANRAGRTNLRDGIAPPDSSHPKFNRCPNDIDYQIEADYSGLIAPGLPQVAIDLGRKFGRLMNYGDGVYGGQFMGGMYAEAFFESDRIKVIEAGLRCIPAESQYAEMVRDMLAWYRQHPGDWQKTWELAYNKYRKDPAYQLASNGPIDVKINGALVLLGLLYGEGDLDKTIVISMRGGHDSDCNPSSAAGVLFTMLGFSKLPDRFTRALDESRVFSHTSYNFPALLDVCEKLARQVVVRSGGRIETGPDGEVFVIPVRDPQPDPLELSWAPGPIANSLYTPEELAKIREPGPRRALKAFNPDWTIEDFGQDPITGLHKEINGRSNVFVTHPYNREVSCKLWRKVEVPAGKQTTLHLTVGHHPEGDWLLIVSADDEKLLEKTIGKETATNGWLDIDVDLSRYAGRTIRLRLTNEANGWQHENAYWARMDIESR